MKVSIFSRLIIGYLIIFTLAMMVSVYAIMQLHYLKNVTRSILTVDNILIDYEHRLSDVMLSMMRYERKFIIIKDDALYSQFTQARNDFDRHVNSILTATDSPETKNLVMSIRQHYRRYLSLFDEEVAYIQSSSQYDVNAYKEQKESAVNEIMEGLRTLRDYNYRNSYDKLSNLNLSEARAGKVAIMIGVIALFFGVVVSAFFTINITRPLSIIKNKTKEIASGNLGSDLQLTSPPEVAELAQSFNLMCQKLKELDRMKTDFFSLMSHELRTPLTTIKEGTKLFLEGLKEGEVTHKQKRLLTIINEECNRLITLVNSLLDLSKMEAGMMVYNLTRADIVSLIRKVNRELEPLADTKNIMIGLHAPADLPAVRLDTDRFLQVLRNLIGNAVKFTPRGGRVQVVAEPAENGVKVSISDTGVGISKEKIETIFDKFRRTPLTDSGKIVGSGLGLFIVKEILTAHGGRIWVESTMGKGSTFTFVLPA